MVQAVASWDIEIYWRGQKEWKRKMTLLQNAALRNTLGVVKGSSWRTPNAIVSVKDVVTFEGRPLVGFL